MENALLDSTCSGCKKRLKNLDVFKFYWDESLNLVYYLMSKYLSINSSCYFSINTILLRDMEYVELLNYKS